MRALDGAPHASAEKVFGAVRIELPSTSLQAVYGVLTAFVASGLVRKVEPAGSAALFERRVGDNHHHLVCTECSLIQDVDCAIGSAPCLVPSNTGGFAVHSAAVTSWGICSGCQTNAAALAR